MRLCSNLWVQALHLVDTIHLMVTERVELDSQQWPLDVVHPESELETEAESDDVIQCSQLSYFSDALRELNSCSPVS